MVLIMSQTRLLKGLRSIKTILMLASILGEPVSFNTFLSGKAMIENIIGVLTIIKLLDIPLESIMYNLENYQPNNGVQNFEHYKKIMVLHIR